MGVTDRGLLGAHVERPEGSASEVWRAKAPPPGFDLKSCHSTKILKVLKFWYKKKKMGTASYLFPSAFISLGACLCLGRHCKGFNLKCEGTSACIFSGS